MVVEKEVIAGAIIIIQDRIITTNMVLHKIEINVVAITDPIKE